MTMKITMRELPEALKFLIEQRVTTLVSGAPGVGKSDCVAQAAAALAGYRYVEIVASLRDPVDMRGLPVPDLKTGKTRWLVPDELPREDRDGEHGVLGLEEISNCGLAMQTACYGLCQTGRLGEYQLPKGWVVIATGNRVSDRAAAQRLSTALRNRFEHIEVEVDVAAWCEWATKNGIDPLLIAFIRFRPELLHVMPKGDENAFPTPRSIALCSKMLGAPEPVRLPLIAGAVGDSMAGELEGFIRVAKELPRIEDIIRDPLHAKVPADNQPAALFAVSAALARKATQKTLGPIAEYLARLPREFEVLGMVDAVRRDKELCNSQGFTGWAVRNQDVVI